MVGEGLGPHLPGVGKHYWAGDRVPWPPKQSPGISDGIGLMSEPAEPLGPESPRSAGVEHGIPQCRGPDVGMCWETARECVCSGGKGLLEALKVLATFTRSVWSPEKVLHREARCFSDSLIDF